MIYVITAFEKVSKDVFGLPDYGDMRTVAYYTDYNDAYNAIMNNYCDMCEDFYNYVALETMPEGIYPTSLNGYKCEYFRYNQLQGKYFCPIDASEVEICEHIAPIWSIG